MTSVKQTITRNWSTFMLLVFSVIYPTFDIKPLLMRIGLVLVVLFGLPSIGVAQINIHNTRHDGAGCLGDLTIFSFSYDATLGTPDYYWDFGDQSSSTQTTPVHFYKKSGVFLITVEATFSNGKLLKDSIDLEVYSLPRADFHYLSSSDTCFYGNYICFVDDSKPAEKKRPIVSRKLTWGDGQQTTFFGQGTPMCHNYGSVGEFKVNMEVYDSIGCKSSAILTAEVVPDVRAKFDYKIDNTCDKSTLCINNVSSVQGGEVATYRWSFDSATSTKFHGFNDPLCFTFDSTGSKQLKLSVTSENGCSDTVTQTISVPVWNPNRKIKFSHEKFCYGDQLFYANVDYAKGESYKWFIDDQEISQSSGTSLRKNGGILPPGNYKIRCEIERSGCKLKLSEDITVHGPIARMKIYNQFQCSTTNRVFFVQQSDYVDSFNTTFKWVVQDPKGGHCVINRAKDINKYHNCDTTIGWFGKHDYTDLSNYNIIRLQVTDNKTGCISQTAGVVYLLQCGQSGIENLCGQIFSACEGEVLPAVFSNNRSVLKWTLDSGQTWRTRNSKLSYPPGTYSLGVIVIKTTPERAEDFGDDSIRIHQEEVYYDTVFCDIKLIVQPGSWENVSFELGEGCHPEGIIKLKNGKFSAGDRLNIYGAGFNSVYLNLKSDTVINTVRLKSYAVGVSGQKVTVRIWRNAGCFEMEKEFYFSFGYNVDMVVNRPCLGQTLRPYGRIRDYKTGEVWGDTNGFGTIDWLFGDSLYATDRFAINIPTDTVGLYKVGMIVKSTSGCVDTFWQNRAVVDVKAHVRKGALRPICNGPRQLFDSSLILYNGSLSNPQLTYSWIADGMRSTQRNPVFVFDGARKFVNVSLSVAYQGCSDQIDFNIRVLTSKPEFFVRDSILCAPATMRFVNTSEGAEHFVWEFGDSNNFTTEVFNTSDVTYEYVNPGRYFARLIGIDKVYDPFVGRTVYCHSIYPELPGKGISVVALPTSHPGLTGPDSLCVNEVGTFWDLDTGLYERTRWYMGDGYTMDRYKADTVNYAYASTGKYKIHLEPDFLGHPVFPKCIDSAAKEVVVFETVADFIVDSLGDDKYQFVNLTDPMRSGYFWDFGHEESGDKNFSTLADPTHDYSPDTGSHEICLIAVLNSCRDTVCKVIDVGFEEYLKTYNVFTPGDLDGQNDQFEVTLKNAQSFDYTIFNRWGEVVYNKVGGPSYKTAILWNGRVNNVGKECPEGTYFYVLKYTFKSSLDKTEVREGTVTLLR